MKTIYLSLSIWTFTIFFSGCGEDPSMYRGETLTFQSPISAKSVKSEKPSATDLQLSEQASSNFHSTRIGADFPPPYPVYPIFDYYAEPIPMQVRVSPFYSMIQLLPPMYWNYYAYPDYSDDDDF
jgi:hypothetical protein